MPKSLLIPAIGLLALAGCSKQEEAEKTNDPAKVIKAAQVAMPQPGKYRATMKVLEVAMPGMPAGQAGMMKNMFGKAGRSFEYCMTKEEAAEGYKQFAKQAAEGKCTYENFSVGGGKISANSTCQTGQGMTAKTEMTGTYSPTGSTMQMSTRSEVPGMPGGAMTMKAEMSQERIGDC